MTKARLEESEQSLQEFARGRNIYALEQEEKVIHDKLADLNMRLTEAESQRIAVEAMYQQSQGPTGSLPLIVNSPLLKVTHGAACGSGGRTRRAGGAIHAGVPQGPRDGCARPADRADWP